MCVSTLLLCPLEVYWIRKLWTLIVVSFIGLEIQGAKEEVKKDRKHKRNEKDRKDRDNEAGRSRKHRHKRRRKDEGAIASGKLVSSEVELLEKSCQTVELELQTSSQNSCDSTLHSNERPKQIQSQPLDETSIRTRLPDKGQEDPEDAGPGSPTVLPEESRETESRPALLEADRPPGRTGSPGRHGTPGQRRFRPELARDPDHHRFCRRWEGNRTATQAPHRGATRGAAR